MSVRVEKNLPPLRRRARTMGNVMLPPMKDQLSARPVDTFKSQKIPGDSVHVVLNFLQESFDLPPTTTPAEMICKIALKMSHTDQKIKKMKEQLMDHDVLLLDVQDELNLGPEFNPIRTARAFKRFIRTSKEHTAYLEKTIKGNETLLKTCKQIAGVSGHHAPDGLANYFSSTWSRQRHVIDKLKNTVQELKEGALSKKDSTLAMDESILELAQVMGVKTSNIHHTSTLVLGLKNTFMSLKNRVNNLNDTVNDKREEIKTLKDGDMANTNHIEKLEQELDLLRKRNQYLTLDLEKVRDERNAANTLVSDLEHKIRDLQIGNDRKELEIEDLLQRYEAAGEVVSNLQSQVDDIKELNHFLQLQIKTMDNAKDDDVADWQIQKKDLELQLENLQDSEFQAKAEILSLKLEMDELKNGKDEINSEIKKLQSSVNEKDQRILDLEKEVATLKKENDERDSIIAASQKVETGNFSWTNGYDVTRPRAHNRTESKTSSLVITLERKISDLELEKKKLTSQLQNGGEKGDCSQKDPTLEAQVGDLLEQKKELGQQLKALCQEKEDMTSQYEAETNRLMREKLELATLLQGMIDQRRESIHLIQQVASDTMASEVILRTVTEKLQTVQQEKEDLVKTHASEISHLRSEIKRLKSKQQIEKDKHRVGTKNTQRDKEEESKVAKQEDNLEKMKATKLKEKMKTMTRENEKLQAKISLLKKKMADLSSHLQKSQQECEDHKKTSNQFKARADSLKDEKDKLSTELTKARQQCQELDEHFAAANQQKELLQVRVDTLETEKDELSAQLRGDQLTHAQQYQDFEDDIAIDCVNEEQILTMQPEISLKESTKEQKHHLSKARQQSQVVEERFPSMNKTKESDQTNINRSTESRNSLSSQLEEANKKYQELEEEFDILHQEKMDFQSLGDSLAEDNYKLSEDLTNAFKDYHALEDKFNAAEEDIEKQEKRVSQLKEENRKLSNELEAASYKTQDQQEYIETLKQRNDELRNQIASVEKKGDGLFEELEKNMELCQDLEDKLAVADRDKAEFEEQTAKWEKERDELTTQLQSTQKQFQDANDRLAFIHDASKLLEIQIADVQNDREELKRKLGIAKQERAELTEKNLASMGKIRDLKANKKGDEEKIKNQECKIQELETKVSTMAELIELLEKKASLAENRQKELEEELQSMRASVTEAAIQFGIFEAVGDSICLRDLFQQLDSMKQLNEHMKMEIAELKKTKATFHEMINLVDPILERGDAGAEEMSPRQREKCEMTERIEDLQYKTYKQESLNKKLRYQLTTYHKKILKERDSMYADMSYADRAVVERIISDVDPCVIKPDQLSFVVGADVDGEDDLIGKGSYGKVFLRQYEGEAVAVKVPYISKGVKDEDDEKRKARIRADYARTTMEALVHLALADHRTFPKLRGIVDYEGAPSLVLEFLGDKKTGTSYSLAQAIKFQIPNLSKENWFDVIQDIVSGLKAIHEKGLLHNDLKANNVLLQWDVGDSRWHAFIIDMGKVSTDTIPLKPKQLPKEEIVAYKTGILYQHLAPEYILDLQPMNVQTDIYSLGKLLERMQTVMRSRPLRELAAEMIDINPRLRPNWKHIQKVISKAQKRNIS